MILVFKMLFSNYPLRWILLNSSEIRALNAMREFRDAKETFRINLHPYKITPQLSQRTTEALCQLQKASDNLKD